MLSINDDSRRDPRFTSVWTSWDNRDELIQVLEPGDILQVTSNVDGFMEHWILFHQKPLCNTSFVHVVSNSSMSISKLSIPSSPLTILALLCALFAIACDGYESYFPLFLFVLIAKFVGTVFTEFFTPDGCIHWDPLEKVWGPGKIVRKHNFKDKEWAPDPLPVITERIRSEDQAGRTYHFLNYNCEQFVHFCRYGKRYSGQVAAFSKDVRKYTLGLVRIYDEFD